LDMAGDLHLCRHPNGLDAAAFHRRGRSAGAVLSHRRGMGKRLCRRCPADLERGLEMKGTIETSLYVERRITMSTMLLASPSMTCAALGVGILRTLRVEFHPIHDGRELMSPDGRFIARATSTYGPCPTSGTQSGYEFSVEDRAGTRIQYVRLPV